MSDFDIPIATLELFRMLERECRQAPGWPSCERRIRELVADDPYHGVDDVVTTVRAELWPHELDRRCHETLDRLGVRPGRVVPIPD